MSDVISSLGSTVNLQMVRGTDQAFVFSLKDKLSDDAAFRPTNLSSSSVKFTVRTALGGSVVFTKTNDPSGHDDAASGVTQFIVRRTDLTALPSKEFVTLFYEVRQITDDSPAQHHVHVSGNLVVKLTAQPASLA